jgi:hypothetical protein
MARKAKNDGTPPGPVPKILDVKTFESLCQVWCTQSEIASYLKMDVTTLARIVTKHYGEDFAVVYKRLYESGTPSFRRERRVLAKTNASMSIWLGKTVLGEKEEQQQIVVSPEMICQFEAFANMFKKAQPDRKMDDNSNKTDIKS